MGMTFARLHRRFWKSQRLSADALNALELQEVRRIARFAYATVPAYREKFDRAGFHPEEIRALADLERFPLTKKEEMRSSPERFRSTAVPASKLLLHRTGGSTGTPMAVYSTKETWLAERAMMYRGWTWAGFRPGDRIVTCVGDLEAPDESAPVQRYRNRLDVSSGHLDPRGLERYASEIRDFAPQFVRTYPTVAFLLGRELEARGIRLPSLKGIWTQSETLPPQMRNEIEELWGCPVRDYYGMQEKCVAMSECEHGTMHIHSEFGHVELLPSGVPPLRRIVATGFWNRAMPLLRYETRDLALPKAEPCRCGRALPAVSRIEGRLEDFLITPGGKWVQELDRAVMNAKHVRECQLIQERLDWARVLVVPDPRFTAEDEAELLRLLRERIGPGVDITLERVAEIPRTSSGKFRFVVSRVKGPDPT